MHRRTFLAAAAALPAAPLLARAKRADDAPLDVEAILEVTKTPGLAAKGVIRGKPFLHLAGVIETGKQTPIAAQTMFSAASLTKPVFTMEVRRLVREGKLDWKTPLRDYLPLGLTGDAASITAEHVLTHGTGLRNWRFDPKDELVSSFKPGTRWGYSGEGYVLLQRVVEKLVGKPLGAHLNETLLPRLGMVNSTFTWTPDVATKAVMGHANSGALHERPAAYYERRTYELAQKAGSTTDRMTYDQMIAAAKQFEGLPLPITVIPNVAGSLWTTIGDYALFLEKSAADYAARPDEYTPRNKVNRHIAWTLSWGVDTSIEPRGYFHWGDGPGVKNIAWWQPSAKTSIVIFTNGDHGASAWRVLLRRLLGADPVAPEWV